MGKIFDVVLSTERKTGGSAYCELILPAQPWVLHDALDILQIEGHAKITTNIVQYLDHEQLEPIIQNNPDLYELNALAIRLSALDERQYAAFYGLIQMKEGEQDTFTIKQLRDLAASVDCCHVVPEAMNDSQLGRFYAENGFIPEVDHVPDSVFKLLDFEQLGRKARKAEEGVYTEYGYVMQDEELIQAPPIQEGSPGRPEYTFRLILEKYPYEEDHFEEHLVPLDLPAAEEELHAALIKLGVPSWDEVRLAYYDGAIPYLDEISERYYGVDKLNELATIVKQITDRGELPKFKAILDATKCTDENDMIDLASQLDQYILERNHQTYEDIALADLRVIAGESALEMLVPHVDMDSYGRAVAEKMNLTLSSYGTISRRDGEPIQTFDSDGPQQGGMEVTM